MTEKEYKKIKCNESFRERTILWDSPILSQNAVTDIVFNNEESEFILEVGQWNYNLARTILAGIEFIKIVLNPKLNADWWLISEHKSIYSFGNLQRVN